MASPCVAAAEESGEREDPPRGVLFRHIEGHLAAYLANASLPLWWSLGLLAGAWSEAIAIVVPFSAIATAALAVVLAAWRRMPSREFHQHSQICLVFLFLNFALPVVPLILGRLVVTITGIGDRFDHDPATISPSPIRFAVATLICGLPFLGYVALCFRSKRRTSCLRVRTG